MSLIGRAGAQLDCVNLTKLLSGVGGGGHHKAAAAAFRMDRLHTMPDAEFAAAESVRLNPLADFVQVARRCTGGPGARESGAVLNVQ